MGHHGAVPGIGGDNMVTANVPLFEHIAKRADEMYTDCLQRAAEHQKAGRCHLAEKMLAEARDYLQFRRSAQRNLLAAKSRSAVAA